MLLVTSRLALKLNREVNVPEGQSLGSTFRRTGGSDPGMVVLLLKFNAVAVQKYTSPFHQCIVSPQSAVQLQTTSSPSHTGDRGMQLKFAKPLAMLSPVNIHVES